MRNWKNSKSFSSHQHPCFHFPPPSVFMVMGIPTVQREKESYLLNTLSSLLLSLTQSHRQELLIIVFVAEVTNTLTHARMLACSHTRPERGGSDLYRTPLMCIPSLRLARVVGWQLDSWVVSTVAWRSLWLSQCSGFLYCFCSVLHRLISLTPGGG